MSLLIDTHIVLWWLADDPTLADDIKERLDREDLNPVEEVHRLRAARAARRAASARWARVDGTYK